MEGRFQRGRARVLPARLPMTEDVVQISLSCLVFFSQHLHLLDFLPPPDTCLSLPNFTKVGPRTLDRLPSQAPTREKEKVSFRVPRSPRVPPLTFASLVSSQTPMLLALAGRRTDAREGARTVGSMTRGSQAGGSCLAPEAKELPRTTGTSRKPQAEKTRQQRGLGFNTGREETGRKEGREKKE